MTDAQCRVAIEAMRRGESIPCGATRINDIGIAFEDAVAEMVLAQELPDVLDGVQLGRIGRQLEQTDIAWEAQLFASLVPSGSIKEQDGVTALRHLAADLLEMQVHRLGVGIRQHQSRADIATRADSAEYVGPFAALIARRWWPATGSAQTCKIAISGDASPNSGQHLFSLDLRQLLENGRAGPRCWPAPVPVPRRSAREPVRPPTQPSRRLLAYQQSVRPCVSPRPFARGS
jgi:hypothetical protein